VICSLSKETLLAAVQARRPCLWFLRTHDLGGGDQVVVHVLTWRAEHGVGDEDEIKEKCPMIVEDFVVGIDTGEIEPV